MRDFNLKKYLANNPLLNEPSFDPMDDPDDIFEKIEHVFSGEDSPEHIQWKESRDDLMTQAEVGIDDLLTSLHDQAYELGGDTNGPGIWYDIKDLLRDKL